MSKEIDLFSGKEIVQNGDEKYSELIFELMDIFKNIIQMKWNFRIKFNLLVTYGIWDA
jgi:hypothetical protein